MFNFSLTFVWKSLTDSVKHDTKDHIDSADLYQKFAEEKRSKWEAVRSCSLSTHIKYLSSANSFIPHFLPNISW